MSWDKIVGPATLVYMAATLGGFIWWASDISTRLVNSESSIVTVKNDLGNLRQSNTNFDPRLARLETAITHVDKQLDRIEDKLDRGGR